ncbi:MAG: hypothetical protein ACU0CO_03785 [Shimia sp.]
MPREAVDIEVLAGTFEDQLAVFAHMHRLAVDWGLELDPDLIEVIAREDPSRRLAHFFDAETAERIEDLVGVRTSVVLLLPGAVAPAPVMDLPGLRGLGVFPGTVVVPG